MNIETPTFVAFNDTRPGHESFSVFGRVTVPHAGIVPVLSRPAVRHRGGWEVLHLTFERLEGIHPQVVTEQLVQFAEPGLNSWSRLEISSEKGTQWMPILSRDI
ncbi:hypothetical protein G7Z99_08940 [Pseudomonas entomophila]|uniref:hypothetical protein n=1 Tax=Pseudomonas entomophila TaxID=312306 RepID=UPI0015E4427D|nr:hypothetical protein [Pseudomonas entomophila]MBA1189175.1 hypothetical protein [Pseudomonas entomophila]